MLSGSTGVLTNWARIIAERNAPPPPPPAASADVDKTALAPALANTPAAPLFSSNGYFAILAGTLFTTGLMVCAKI